MSDHNNSTRKDELRAWMLGTLWTICGIALAFLFISAAAQQALTLAHVVITTILIGAAFAGTNFIWNGFAPDNMQEKAKRDRIDTMLRDMSDEELLQLKNRLSDGDYSEDTILDFISDDGELVTRS